MHVAIHGEVEDRQLHAAGIRSADLPLRRLTWTITGTQPAITAVLKRPPQPQPAGARQNFDRARCMWYSSRPPGWIS